MRQLKLKSGERKWVFIAYKEINKYHFKLIKFMGKFNGVTANT